MGGCNADTRNSAEAAAVLPTNRAPQHPPAIPLTAPMVNRVIEALDEKTPDMNEGRISHPWISR